VKGLLLSGVLLLGGLGLPASAKQSDSPFGQCGSVDLVFAIDKTYSIGRAIGEVKAEARRLLNLVAQVSAGKYRLGLISFRDDIDVDLDLTDPADPEAASAPSAKRCSKSALKAATAGRKPLTRRYAPPLKAYPPAAGAPNAGISLAIGRRPQKFWS